MTRIVLDTCVLRTHIHGTDNTIVDDLHIISQKTGNVEYSLSYTAYLELMAALLGVNDGDGIPWQEWVNRIKDFENILDSNMPIMPDFPLLARYMGIDLGQGLNIDQQSDSMISKARWRLLSEATSENDLYTGVEFTNQQGGRSRLIAEEKSSMKKSLVQKRSTFFSYVNDSASSDMNAKKLYHQASGAFSRDPKVTTECLEPVFDLAVQHIESVRGGAKIEDNDPGHAFDWDMLYALGFPAGICTVEKRLLRKLQSGTKVKYQIINWSTERLSLIFPPPIATNLIGNGEFLIVTPPDTFRPKGRRKHIKRRIVGFLRNIYNRIRGQATGLYFRFIRPKKNRQRASARPKS